MPGSQERACLKGQGLWAGDKTHVYSSTTATCSARQQVNSGYKCQMQTCWWHQNSQRSAGRDSAS